MHAQAAYSIAHVRKRVHARTHERTHTHARGASLQPHIEREDILFQKHELTTVRSAYIEHKVSMGDDSRPSTRARAHTHAHTRTRTHARAHT
jgi:hypothetical protein